MIDGSGIMILVTTYWCVCCNNTHPLPYLILLLGISIPASLYHLHEYNIPTWKQVEYQRYKQQLLARWTSLVWSRQALSCGMLNLIIEPEQSVHLGMRYCIWWPILAPSLQMHRILFVPPVSVKWGWISFNAWIRTLLIAHYLSSDWQIGKRIVYCHHCTRLWYCSRRLFTGRMRS